ncbi:sulfate adenylyltransferase [Purpureocillium lavendulum]|uniref:Sulfate adenylyltransferase n=1 Tax=Purpureocillium lavendulum TaxID=1247861 RepID=A0AB34FXJ7_9HYPO|nr:sulfate adenylyltransferase [Purpureocillium lavendulum]
MPAHHDENAGATAEAFGNIYIVPPAGQHTNTIIFLHGRGSTGREFFEDLGCSVMSNLRTLPSALTGRGYRLVFPTSRLLYSSVFHEWTPGWLETFFYAGNESDRHEAVARGISDGTQFLHSLMLDEVGRLGGNARKVFLVGISEGGSIGMWTLFTLPPALQGLGGFIGLNTSLPFAPSILRILRGESHGAREGAPMKAEHRRQDAFVTEKLGTLLSQVRRERQEPLPRAVQTPVLLTHGADGKLVDAELGREAWDTLNAMGFRAAWVEYTGAAEEGHWIKEPEGLDDIFEFITGSR